MYSPDETVAEQLRAPEGGLLKVKNDEETNHQDFPTETSGAKNCPLGGITPQPGGRCFLSDSLLFSTKYSDLNQGRTYWEFHRFREHHSRPYISVDKIL